jgi:antitoxin component YwqK of YwqJK toxin-antitoxin module
LKSFLLLILLSLIFFACNKKDDQGISKPLVLRDGILYEDTVSVKPFTGRNKSRMLDMMIEYDVVDGLKNGDFIVYFPDGKVQMAGMMEKNKNVGLWKYYYKNGALQSAGYFNDDKPDSVWIWYNETGIIIEQGSFKMGMRNGEWNSYDSTGILSIVRSYRNNQLIDSVKIN